MFVILFKKNRILTLWSQSSRFIGGELFIVQSKYTSDPSLMFETLKFLPKLIFSLGGSM